MFASQIFALVSPMLSKEEIYQCRMVCRRWTEAIDSFLENHPCLQSIINDAADLNGKRQNDLEDYTRFPVRLMLEKTLHRFDRIEIPSPNPFIGRSIIINPDITNFGWETDFAEHLSPKFEKLCKILERFGNFIYQVRRIVSLPGSADEKSL